ncbi:hypothetical protein C0J52_10933 [Blattella germanica]|nr:hypothetical protein C0J52_10933 [Blattella germanica]
MWRTSSEKVLAKCLKYIFPKTECRYMHSFARYGLIYSIFRFFRESASNSKLTLFILKIFYYCFCRNICYVIGRSI